MKNLLKITSNSSAKASVKIFFLLALLIWGISCNSQNNTKIEPKKDSILVVRYIPAWLNPNVFKSPQISQYIRRMFQDKAGNIWFGTNGDGVCRYDGVRFEYFTTYQGLAGNAVRAILQDDDGNIWFATNGGISRFDGNSFTNFTTENGLAHNEVWSMLRDKTGSFWFGTEGGISRFDPKKNDFGEKIMTNFALPVANLKDAPRAYQAPKLINNIIQDKKGIIWFGSNGNGVYRYDGKILSNVSEKDGLCNNFVQSILEDKAGNMWFATRFGGVSKFDGKNFTTFSEKEGLSNNFAWTLMEDKFGYIWLASAGGGITRFSPSAARRSDSLETGGKTLINFSKKDGLGNLFVQSILEDKNGQLWFGTSGGVYRLFGKTFVNFIKNEGC